MHGQKPLHQNSQDLRPEHKHLEPNVMLKMYTVIPILFVAKYVLTQKTYENILHEYNLRLRIGPKNGQYATTA